MRGERDIPRAGPGGRIRLAPLLALLCAMIAGFPGSSVGAPPCRPTPEDLEGPFYLPGAPERDRTGTGLSVRGRVLGSPDCRPLPGARLEWWQTDSRGRYADTHRGSLRVPADGTYRFDTDFPGVYPGRPPHIHLKVFFPGYRTLTTQLYLKGGQTEADFDLVLVPDR